MDSFTSQDPVSLFNVSQLITEVNSSFSITCEENRTVLLPTAWYGFFENQLDLLCVTNVHWFDFDPPTSLERLSIFAAYLLIMVTGCIGNGLVVFLTCSSRSLRTPSNLFILNLAISDLLMVSKIMTVCPNMFTFDTSISKFGCDMYAFFGGLTGTCSIMTLAAISFDRYLVIAYPLDPFKKLSQRQVLGIIIAIWMYAASFSSIPLMGIDGISYSPEGFLTTCSFDYLSEDGGTRAFIAIFFVAAWVVPLIIISYSYSTILLTVTRHEKGYRSQSLPSLKDSCKRGSQGIKFPFRNQPSINVPSEEEAVGSPNSFKHNKKEKTELKLARIALCIVGLWVASWTPYAIVALLGISGQSQLIAPLSSMIPALFCKSAACCNPFIYALSHPRYKNEIQKRVFNRIGFQMRNVNSSKIQRRNRSIDSDFRSELSDTNISGEMKLSTGLKSEEEKSVVENETTFIETNLYRTMTVVNKKDPKCTAVFKLKIAPKNPRSKLQRTLSLDGFNSDPAQPIRRCHSEGARRLDLSDDPSSDIKGVSSVLKTITTCGHT